MEQRLAGARHYSSYLIRYWQRGDGERHFQVEHIQSGRRMHAASAEQAIAWLTAAWAPAAEWSKEAEPSRPTTSAAADRLDEAATSEPPTGRHRQRPINVSERP
jgi:hypothetical protein